MTSMLYRGSVKNLWGPVKLGSEDAVVFEYTDAYSVFDWGKMPDLLPKKGEALAVLAAEWFEKLESPEVWKEYSKTSDAHALRKANRFGGLFNEVGEELQSQGLRTHYRGVCEASPVSVQNVEPKRLAQLSRPAKFLAVQQVSVVKPQQAVIFGRTVPDYQATRNSSLPRLVPLEVVFRMGCPPGSSLIERAAKDPGYTASLGFPDLVVEPGARWNFPILELFTKLETSDRLLSFSEALAISGITAVQLQEILFKTIWVAGILRFWCSQRGLELADGKLEWAMAENGKCFLVDAIGPDELRLMKNGVQLSKEFLRGFYRNTSWYHAVEKAKAQAKVQGIADWKKLVQETPPTLPAGFRELASQVYLVLAHELTGQRFPEAWSLEKVIRELKIAEEQRAGHA